METELTYWDIKEVVGRIVPRQSVLGSLSEAHRMRVRKTGRRSGPWYREYRLNPEGWQEFSRVLPDTFDNSALMVSRKACGCPLPLNLDVWDGPVCSFNCLYCFANYFRTTLYSSFFDQVQPLRTIDADAFLARLGALMDGGAQGGQSAERRALDLRVPIRIGVRFENFIPKERKVGTALRVLRFLAERGYPVIVDTKSTLVGEDEYLRALADNAGGAVVQFSLSSGDDAFLREIEPGAPLASERFEALRRLNEAGVRGVARIEPFLPFLADSEEWARNYVGRCREAGVGYVCWDAFSYSCANEHTRRLFHQRGLDFDRMFYAASDSRLATGLLLWAMMRHFRSEGLRCSTYDDTVSQYNDDVLCCQVTGAFKGGFGWNVGSSKGAEDYIRRQGGRAVSWGEFDAYVEGAGGWLSAGLRRDFWQLWNLDGDSAYSMAWSSVEPAGMGDGGMMWRAAADNRVLVDALRYVEMEAGRG